MRDATTVCSALGALLTELMNGASPQWAFVLNPEDQGLLRSLDQLSAAAASAVPTKGTSSIAAHVDHLRYGFELLNRWSRGENPFESADYSASWRRVTVSADEWLSLRSALRRESSAWLEAIEHPEQTSRNLGPAYASLNGVELAGVIGSVVHLAYHLGAIRQIDATTRGPRALD